MARYRIDTQKSELRVTAHSSVHDTLIRWSGITGMVDADPNDVAATRATVEVDMSTADAGDWMKNRKVRKDMDFAHHPTAKFVVDSLTEVVNENGQTSATVHGKLSWHGHTMSVEASGSGTVGDRDIVATGRFSIDITKLGVKPPKVLMIKVADLVTCEIQLHAVLQDPESI